MVRKGTPAKVAGDKKEGSDKAEIYAIGPIGGDCVNTTVIIN